MREICQKRNIRHNKLVHMSNKAAILNPALKVFSAFIGNWKTAGTHPQMPGVTLHGYSTIQWTEGGAFVSIHATIDHEAFPDNVSIFGSDNSLGTFFMLYFDE